MATIWVLDEDHKHVLTIDADEGRKALLYAINICPADYHIDTIGPKCANARFDLNPNAEEVSL